MRKTSNSDSIRFSEIRGDDEDLRNEVPNYRVAFWEQRRGSTPEVAWYSLAGAAGFSEVLAWTEVEAQGRLVAIYVEVTRGAEVELYRLTGHDPNDGEPVSITISNG
ncbi:hypothetical protein [Gordonia sp. UBA7860]|uniref:hypothetical protein n=1 Tax=Gordonia sp. UBA7860 TaxID=1946579 RepID=UPI00257EA3ED|nr:hypothetical protein [Gordonia sp. UBA7860]